MALLHETYDFSFLPDRIGEEQEALIREYKEHPTEKVKLYVVQLCSRFIKFFYGKFRVPEDRHDFAQAGAERVLELLEEYDPTVGPFVGWALVGLEGLAKSRRYKSNKYENKNKFVGLRTPEVAGDSEGYHTESAVIKKYEYSDLKAILAATKTRFQNQVTRRVIRGIIRYLVRNNKYPTIQELQNYWATQGMPAESIEFLYYYTKIIVTIQTRKEWIP